MLKGISSTLVKFGLATADDPPSSVSPVAVAPVSSGPAAMPPLQVVPTGNADTAMVNSLKASVLGAAPIIGQFMQNVEIARASFPNDETACMKAALAFTHVDKATLIGELDRTVAAALLHAKNGIEGERQKARDSAIGSLEKNLATVNSDIKEMEVRITEMQQSIAQKRAEEGQLQGKVRDAEADLQRQDNVVNASFAQVEQVLASFKQTLSKL